MTDIDDVTEALLRRIEASVDVDDALAALDRRLDQRHRRGVTRWSIAAAVALAVISVAVVLRAGAGEPSSRTVGVSGVDEPAPVPPPVGVEPTTPFLMLDPATWTLTALMTFAPPAAQAAAPMRSVSQPVAVYASDRDDGPVVAIERADTPPETVGTGQPSSGAPFVAGPWAGTVRVTGTDASPVRSAVVRGADLADGWLVVTGRQIDEQAFVDLVAGLHRTEGAWRLADDRGLVLVSDGAAPPNADGWSAEWQGAAGEVQVNSYRETGNPRFIERLAASPTMTRIDVSGRPGAVFESGGYTVYSWLATPVDVVEIRVEGEGPAAVAQAAALARSARLATEAELRALLPDAGQVASAPSRTDAADATTPSTVVADTGSCVVTDASPGGCVVDPAAAEALLGFSLPVLDGLPDDLTVRQVSVVRYPQGTPRHPSNQEVVMASLLAASPGDAPTDPSWRWLRLRVSSLAPSEPPALGGPPLQLVAPQFGGVIHASGVVAEPSTTGTASRSTLATTDLEWIADGFWYALEGDGVTEAEVRAVIAALMPATPH